MGIVVPRPAMRGAERRKIEAALRRHAALGLERDEASRRAYQDMRSKRSDK